MKVLTNLFLDELDNSFISYNPCTLVKAFRQVVYLNKKVKDKQGLKTKKLLLIWFILLDRCVKNIWKYNFTSPYFPTVPLSKTSRSKCSDLHAISRSIDLGARVRRAGALTVAWHSMGEKRSGGYLDSFCWTSRSAIWRWNVQSIFADPT